MCVCVSEWNLTGRDEEVHQHRLELGLPRFEVVSGDEDPAEFSALHHARYDCVLRGTIDVSALGNSFKSL